MNGTVKGILLLGFLSVGFRTGGGDSREVEILLTDGGSITGEILAVRDTTMLVAMPAGVSEEDLLNGEQVLIMEFPHRRVLKVQANGSSYVLVGIASGLVLGCLGGGAIGAGRDVDVQRKESDTFGCTACNEAASEQIGNTTSGAAIGALVGSLAGLAIGGASSRSDEVYISPSQRDFTALKQVARYPKFEPGYLQTIAQ